MNKIDQTDVASLKYRLTIVEPTAPPEGMPDGNWHRYVVEYGKSKINCVRSGTLQEVTQHATEFVENLNTRTSIGYSSYAQRKVKK